MVSITWFDNKKPVLSCCIFLVYYYLCYEGGIEIDNICDMAKRHAIEVQISEFGQIPKQLFTQPHVPRLTAAIPAEISDASKNILQPTVPLDGFGVHLNESIAPLFEYQCHKDDITSILFDSASKYIYSTSKDGSFKCFDLVNQKQIRSVYLGPMPVSSCFKIPATDVYILGSWDNNL